MRLLIYGSRSFASTVAELARHCDFEVEGFVDDFDRGPNIIGTFAEVCVSHPPGRFAFAIGVGYNDLGLRWDARTRVIMAGYAQPALIHPRAYTADSAEIGDGSLVMARSVVDVRATIGQLVVLWPNACINHDAAVGPNTFVSPGAIVCGAVKLGTHCFVRAGAAVADHCVVPDGTFIKMLSRYSADRRLES